MATLRSVLARPITVFASAFGPALVAAVAVASVSCGASRSEVYRAKTSAYDTDFAVVFSHTLNVVRDLYPHFVENPSAGWIKTAWHPLRVSTNGGGQQQVEMVNSDPGQRNPAFQGTVPYKRYFVRFRVHVIGGRPWRVRVEGEASEWEAGAIPTPMRGAETPPWLKGRTEALQVAIYRRLKKFAVPIEQAVERDDAPVALPEDPTEFGELPEEATGVVRSILTAAREGDFPALRAHMADGFTWSAGAPPSADQAIVMLQADPTLLAELISLLEGGCAVVDDGAAISCPPEPKPTGYRAGFGQVDGQWRLTYFLAGD